MNNIKENLKLCDLCEGDIVVITPHEKFPNADRELDFYMLTPEGILYGVSERCDGCIMPYSWIKEFTVRKRGVANNEERAYCNYDPV